MDKINQGAIPDRNHDRISQRGCDPGKLLPMVNQNITEPFLFVQISVI